MRWAWRVCARTSVRDVTEVGEDVEVPTPVRDVVRQRANAVTEREHLVDAGRPGAHEGTRLRGLSEQDRTVE